MNLSAVSITQRRNGTFRTAPACQPRRVARAGNPYLGVTALEGTYGAGSNRQRSVKATGVGPRGGHLPSRNCRIRRNVWSGAGPPERAFASPPVFVGQTALVGNVSRLQCWLGPRMGTPSGNTFPLQSASTRSLGVARGRRRRFPPDVVGTYVIYLSYCVLLWYIEVRRFLWLLLIVFRQ